MMATLRVASGTYGSALAWIVAEPTPTLVTETVPVVEPAEMKVVAGTLATLGSLELKFTVRPPAGAGADRFSVSRFSLPFILVVKLASAKFRVAVT
jgi:hypothetical protein